MPTRVRREMPAEGTKPASHDLLADRELEAFYLEIFLPLVRRVTWKHHLPREDARDIVQDAFVLALTRLNKAGNPRAWLIQVVDHLSINHRRKAVRRASLASRWGFGGKAKPGEEAKDASD